MYKMFLVFLLFVVVVGCGQGTTADTTGFISDQKISLKSFFAPAPPNGMKASLALSDNGVTIITVDMIVKDDGSTTATISNVPSGNHTFTITYFFVGGESF